MSQKSSSRKGSRKPSKKSSQTTGKTKKQKKKRVSPLDRDVAELRQGPGVLRVAKKQQTDKHDVSEEPFEDKALDSKTSKKVLSVVHDQLAEMDQESDVKSTGRRAQKSGSAAVERVIQRMSKIGAGDRERGDDDAEDEDDDENHEDIEIDEADEEAFKQFMPSERAPGEKRLLSDIIMEKIRERESQASASHGAGHGGHGAMDTDDGDSDGSSKPRSEEKGKGKNKGIGKAESSDDIRSKQPVELQQALAKLAKVMRFYSSGKMPKILAMIPKLRNWDEILLLTDPDHWSPGATSYATRIFASALKDPEAQRFYSMILLPRVRDDIADHKRLNFHLYQAVKKALFRPTAFFRGLLLPLAESGCTAREAIIFASILNKCSIPPLHAAVGLAKLAELKYTGGTTLFIKTLLNKKFSLPQKTIAGLVEHFCNYAKDDRLYPVIWHQALLTFVQRYKLEFTPDQREAIRLLLKAKPHKVGSTIGYRSSLQGITDEIRRELFAQAPMLVVGDGAFSGSSSSSISTSRPPSRRGSVSVSLTGSSFAFTGDVALSALGQQSQSQRVEAKGYGQSRTTTTVSKSSLAGTSPSFAFAGFEFDTGVKSVKSGMDTST